MYDFKCAGVDKIEHLIEFLDAEEMKTALLEVIKEQGLTHNQHRLLEDMGMQVTNNIGRNK